MFEWNKKEAPIKALAGMGGGVGRGPIGGGGIDATGGTKIPAESSGNGYTYHVFIAHANTNFVVNGAPADATIEILCIGGGGSGGYFYGSGGGAGGAVHSTSFPITTGTYHAFVGAGAGARPFANGYGNNGGASYFKPAPAPAAPSSTNLYAMGGGGGGYQGNPDSVFDPTYRNSTGCGGGANPPATPHIAPNFPSTSQHPTATKRGGGSFNGGRGSSSNHGGGGGGLGGNSNVTQAIGVPGHAYPGFPAPVIAPAIPGPVQPIWIPAVGPTGLYGGGGHGYLAPGGNRAPGGGGGWSNGNQEYANGVSYTGGGGSGPTGPVKGAGGPGIVMVRYQPT